MDSEYSAHIINCAVKKLTAAKKELTENELVRGIVHLLKKELGEQDLRHSSKGRFRKDSFKYIIGTQQWKDSIIQLPSKKYGIASEYDSFIGINDSDMFLSFDKANKEHAQKNILEIIKKIHPIKFEHLVKDVVNKTFPGHNFTVTKASGDGGIDVYGTKDDPIHQGKREAVFIQVKKYEGTVGRDKADGFIGAVTTIINKKENNFSKFTGLFVTSGKFPPSFHEKLNSSGVTGVTFSSWDGHQLSDKMLSYGCGVKYSVDLDFWEGIDPSIIPKTKKQG